VQCVNSHCPAGRRLLNRDLTAAASICNRFVFKFLLGGELGAGLFVPEGRAGQKGGDSGRLFITSHSWRTLTRLAQHRLVLGVGNARIRVPEPPPFLLRYVRQPAHAPAADFTARAARARAHTCAPACARARACYPPKAP
jgi:hypothetical protein